MSRCAILVDAGYFFAAGGFLINSNTNISRKNLQLIDPACTVAEINARAATISNKEILRIYWYDALLGNRMSLEQTELAHQAGLKIRLGSVNGAGEQKGVDSLIVTDLIDLARNGAIADAIIFSGDEDLRICVQVAQGYGVKVHLLGIGNIDKNMSPALRMEADSVTALDLPWMQKVLQMVPAPAPVAPIAKEADPAATGAAIAAAKPVPAALAAAPAALTIEQAADAASRDIFKKHGPEALKALVTHLATSHAVPPEFDRPLIAITATKLGRDLVGAEKRSARGVFITALRLLPLA